MKTIRVLLFLLVVACPTTTNIYANDPPQLCGITGMGYVCRPCDPETEPDCPPPTSANTADSEDNQSPLGLTFNSHKSESETLFDYLINVFW